jgi:gamma-glutamyl-gamma-aminobutyrate hydrolase PuuD
MDNGKLWQHVTNHAYGGPEAHKIITITGEVIPTNSAHHQMMRPAPYTTTVVGWSHLVRSPVKWNQDGEHETQEKEPELVWFQKLNAIGVQGHPEWLPHNSPLTMYTKRMLKEYLNVEI